MKEAALWTENLSITVPEPELPGATSKRTDVGLPTSFSLQGNQDTEDGTALSSPHALRTCSCKLVPAPLSRLRWTAPTAFARRSARREL